MVSVHRILAKLRVRPGLTVLVGKAYQHVMMMLQPPYRFLKGQIMTSIANMMKLHGLVTICDVTEHVLPSNLLRQIYITISCFKTSFLYFK